MGSNLQVPTRLIAVTSLISLVSHFVIFQKRLCCLQCPKNPICLICAMCPNCPMCPMCGFCYICPRCTAPMCPRMRPNINQKKLLKRKKKLSASQISGSGHCSSGLDCRSRRVGLESCTLCRSPCHPCLSPWVTINTNLSKNQTKRNH